VLFCAPFGYSTTLVAYPIVFERRQKFRDMLARQFSEAVAKLTGWADSTMTLVMSVTSTLMSIEIPVFPITMESFTI